MQAIGFLPLYQKGNLFKKKFLGRPLFCWVLAEAIFSDLDEIVVATNNEDVLFFISKNYAWTSKIKTSSLEEKDPKNVVFKRFIDGNEKNNPIFCLLNAFAPFLNAQNINQGISEVKNANFDTVVSVVPLKKSLRNAETGKKLPNELVLVENDALLCTKTSKFASEEIKTGTLEMPTEATFSISKKNWETGERSMAEKLISQKESKAIKYLVLDVDGVFTDGGVYYDENGELTKRFDIRDGMGLEILREHNVEVVVMTSEDSALVKKRMEKLKIKHIFMFAKDKHSLLENFIKKNNISRGEVAYIGDDVNDLANLVSVGWSFCPLNATNQVKPFVDVVLSQNSGNGAIREATERILTYNKRF